MDGPVPDNELLELLRRGLDERRHGAGTGSFGPSPVPHAASAMSAVRGTCREPQIDTPTSAADVAAVLDWMLDGLAAVGALERRNDAAELSPLGHWAVRAKLEEICTVAQTAAATSSRTRWSCSPPAPTTPRGRPRRVPGLGRRPAGRPRGRRAAGRRPRRGRPAARPRLRGPAGRRGPAEQAVRAAVDEQVLRPYALLWLAERSDDGPVSPADVLGAEDAAWLWVDTAAAVLDHGDTALLVPHVEGASAGEPVRLFNRARQSGHPRAASVLTAVSGVHPDPSVARAARRSAFSVHDGGAGR
ncbi:hypothetical protein ACFQ1I_32020 [Kitasatospora arboriphila]